MEKIEWNHFASTTIQEKYDHAVKHNLWFVNYDLDVNPIWYSPKQVKEWCEKNKVKMNTYHTIMNADSSHWRVEDPKEYLQQLMNDVNRTLELHLRLVKQLLDNK